MQLAEYGAILFLLIFGLGFVAVSLFANKLVAPHKPNPTKLANYECGEIPVGTPWVQFNIRYYIIAIIFIIFEMEVVFLLPCTVVFKSFNPMIIALFEVMVFVVILGLGLAYAWSTGNLEWIKPPSSDDLIKKTKGK